MNSDILITGASSGVGKALAIYLSSKYDVIVLARRKDKMIKNFSKYNNIYIYDVDITDDIKLNKTLNLIKEERGEILRIINCSGILVEQKLDNINFDDLDYSIKLNAISPFKIINKFLPNMKKNNFGRIVNLTSGAPLNCFANFGLYSSSKSILNSLTVTLAKELELELLNIKVNLMSPGPVKSEMAPNAPMEPSVCFSTVDYLLGLDKQGETGKFFWLGYEVPLFPNLEGVEWLKGIGNEKLRKVI